MYNLIYNFFINIFNLSLFKHLMKNEHKIILYIFNFLYYNLKFKENI